MSRPKRIAAIALLVVFAAVVVYFLVRPKPSPVELAVERAGDREEQYEALRRETRRRADVARVPESDRFPLGANVKPLDSTSSPTEPARKPPLVYVAPFTTASLAAETPQEAASLPFDRTLRFLLRASPADELALNLVHYEHMVMPLRRGGDARLEGRTPQEYADDAWRIGADVLVYGQVVSAQGSGGRLISQAVVVDMHTSKSQQFSTQPAEQEWALAAEVARKIQEMSGVPAETIAKMQEQNSLPSAADVQALAAISASGAKPAEKLAEYEKLLSGENVVPLTIDAAAADVQSSDSITVLNLGLSKFPDDARLLQYKAWALNRTGRTTAAELVLSHLVRRYPESVQVQHDVVGMLRRRYRNQYWAGDAPAPAVKAFLAQMEWAAQRTPENWGLQWDYAIACDAAVRYYNRGSISGQEPIMGMLRDVMEFRDDSVRHCEAALARRRDSPKLVSDSIWLRTGTRHEDPALIQARIGRLNVMDPTMYGAELNYARTRNDETSNAKALEICRRVAQRLPDDADAQAAVANTIAARLYQEMFRLGGGKYDESIRNVLYDKNPQTDLFLQCMEKAIAGRAELSLESAFAFRSTHYIRGTLGERLPWLNEYLNKIKADLQAAEKRGDWASVLRYARAVDGFLDDPSAGAHRIGYYQVKALWKLGELDEAKRKAESLIPKYKEHATFLYLYAIISLEQGEDLEKALQYAEAAAPLDTWNQGLVDTMRALQGRLGR